MNGIRNLIQNTTPRGRMVMAASALGVIVIAFFFMKIASAPTYEQIVSSADPAETPKVTEALDKAGVKYEVRNNGTAIAVEKAKVGEAKVALAGAGLPGHAQPGFELMEKQKLGASDFQQKVTYQRALEGEIARTVEGVQGVQSAQVNLVLADEQLFQDEQQPARASVLLTTDGGGIEQGSVRGVASLVTSSVKGLKSENVSITDQTGNLLWPKQGAGDGSVMSKQQAEQRYAQGAEAKLNAMLIQTLGPGKGQVQVSADVNADKTRREELSYAKKGTPLKTHEEREELEGSGAGGGGAAGSAGNIPQYANGANGGGDSNYNHETEDTEFGVGKVVERTEVAPGAVNRQNVAVVVDKAVPAADVAALEETLATAAGIDEARGDTISVSQVAFAKPEEPKKPGPADGALGMAKWILLALAMLLFLFFVTRHLRRHESEQLEPVWLREIETPTPLADLEGERTAFLEPPTNPVREQVEEIVEQHPERVAQQVRAWLNSGA